MSIKIKPYEAPDGYSDMYVKPDKMMFSLLSADNQMVGPLVSCKDYLQNRIHGFLLGKPGWKEYHYVPNKMADIDLEKTRLIVCRQLPQGELEEEMELAMDLLHPLEKDLGLIRSKFKSLTGIKAEYGTAYVIEASKRWMLAPPMINLLAFLARNARNHKIGQAYLTTILNSKDDDIVKTFPTTKPLEKIAKAVGFIVKKKYWKVFGKEMNENYGMDTIGWMHKCGIYAYSANYLNDTHKVSDYWKHWLLPSVPQIKTT